MKVKASKTSFIFLATCCASSSNGAASVSNFKNQYQGNNTSSDLYRLHWRKTFYEKGEVIGEHRFIGLYTSPAYQSHPQDIPFLRRKVELVMNNSKLSRAGHAGKALIDIL